jgi:hypothetical protein
MLALSDEALARLAIGASRVRPSARGRWLQRLAAKLDPPAKPKTRQGRWRQRQRNGRAIYRLELHVERLVDALIANQRLSERDAEQHARVEAALAEMVADYVARWAQR